MKSSPSARCKFDYKIVTFVQLEMPRNIVVPLGIWVASSSFSSHVSWTNLSYQILKILHDDICLSFELCCLGVVYFKLVTFWIEINLMQGRNKCDANGRESQLKYKQYMQYFPSIWLGELTSWHSGSSNEV